MPNVKEIKINKIESYDVKDLDVYNIELESKEEIDDLFYTDFESGLIHHNCLRKDFGLVNQDFPQTDLLLQAYKINEFMPKFYCDLVGDQIIDKNVGVLGYTMKGDSDDTRDALTPKLIRYIDKYVPKNIFVSEPFLPLGHYDDTKFNEYTFENEKTEDVINKSDIIFIAINHTEFKKLDKNLFKGKIVVDVWNLFKEKTVNSW